jgi:hypothetical protein
MLPMLQGLERPEVHLRALRDGVHRDGPLGGTKELHYNIGAGLATEHRCSSNGSNVMWQFL